METIKFRLNLKMVDNSEGEGLEDLEYLATQDPYMPNSTIITWVDNGNWHKTSYATEDVAKYFKNNVWTKQ